MSPQKYYFGQIMKNKKLCRVCEPLDILTQVYALKWSAISEQAFMPM